MVCWKGAIPHEIGGRGVEAAATSSAVPLAVDGLGDASITGNETENMKSEMIQTD